MFFTFPEGGKLDSGSSKQAGCSELLEVVISDLSETVKG